MNIGGALRRCEEEDDDSARRRLHRRRGSGRCAWTAGGSTPPPPSPVFTTNQNITVDDRNIRRPENAPAKSIERERLKLRIAGLSGTNAGGHRGKAFGRAGARRFEKGVGWERRRRVMTPTPQQIEKKSDETHSKRAVGGARGHGDREDRSERRAEARAPSCRRGGALDGGASATSRARRARARTPRNELKRRLAAVEAERDGERDGLL